MKTFSGLRSRWTIPRAWAAVHGLAHRPWRTRRHQLPERRTLEQLRDDEWYACIRANIVNGNDVRVVERGDSARLTFETLATVGVAHPDGRQDFDCDVAAQTRIVSPVDLAHAAGAEHTRDLIRAEPRSWVQWHGAAL